MSEEKLNQIESMLIKLYKNGESCAVNIEGCTKMLKIVQQPIKFVQQKTRLSSKK